MKYVCVNLDDTVADLSSSFIRYYNDNFKTSFIQERVPIDMFRVKIENFDNVWQEFVSLGYLQTIDVVPSAKKVLAKFTHENRYKLICVAARNEQNDTYKWLIDNHLFPLIFDDVIFIKNQSVTIDERNSFFIDSNLQRVKIIKSSNPGCKTILLKRFNLFIRKNKYIDYTANSWESIEKIIGEKK